MSLKKKTIKKKKVVAKKKLAKKVVKKKTIKKKKVVAKKQPAKKVVKKEPAKEISVRVSHIKTPSLLRGMKDLLPKDEKYWKKTHQVAEAVSTAYGFKYFDTPVVEEAALFIRSIGRGTDIVDKEMYMFEDKDGSKVALRPELTAGVARAYIGHGMHSYPQPVKLWYYGPMFRHDRPQAGRYRQFHQFGCETLGVHDPVVDAELIATAYHFLSDLGVKINVHINSLGAPEDRQNYIIELVGYLRAKRSYLCGDCKKRISKNPLRVLDCKNEDCLQIIEEAPQIIDWLSEASKDYFTKVLEYLDAVEVPYVLQATLVRGLDYYTDTVFEFYEESEEQTNQNALGGGGRYDPLIEQLGGQETPGAGFSIGLERVLSVLRKQAEEDKLTWQETKPKLFFAQLGEQARMQALRIIEELRQKDIFVYHNLGKTALKIQMELADKYKVPYSLILGQKEVQDGTIIIRDMESGIQEIVDQKKLKNALEKKLGKV